MPLVSVDDHPLRRGRARVARLGDIERRNAISFELLGELERLIEGLATDDGIVVLILTHAGPVFCAGTDLRALTSVLDDDSALRDFLGRIVTLFDRLERLPLPTIAALDGVAVGGGFELALACDFRILQPASWVSLPEVTLGAVPGGGGAHRLHRLVGRSRALELALTGDRLDAATCEDLGLCRVADSQTSSEAALTLADRLSVNSSRAMAETKGLLLDSEAQPSAEMRAAAVEAMIRALNSPDGRLGLEAMRDRQSPEFTETPPFPDARA